MNVIGHLPASILRAATLAASLALGACATTTPLPPGTVVATAKADSITPGVTTRAQLLAQLGPTTSIRFDNGVEVWRYLLPGPGPGGGAAGVTYGEYVVVLDARGIVAKARRAPVVYQVPEQK